jgi:uncharacterized protein (TIRG00374 family)
MPSARTQRIAVTAVGLVGSGVFVALAFRRLDVRSVIAAWSDVHLWPWVPLAVLAYVVGHFVRGQRLRILVQRESALSVTTATNVVVVGYASNNVFPARLGELARAGMLAERTGIPAAQALTVTFIERLLDGIAILILLLVGTWALPQAPRWMWSVARVGSIAFGSALAVVLVAVLLPSVVLSAASRLSAPLGPRARDRALMLASSITNAGAVLRRARDATVIGAYSFAVWILETTMFACILPVFSRGFSLASAMVVMSVTNLGILVPSSPGFVGAFHYFCKEGLVAQGVPEGTAMAYAVLVHLTFYVPVTLWGAGAILWYGVQVGATAALARTARQSPKAESVDGLPVHVIARLERPPPERAPSDFDVALCAAMLAGGSRGDREHVRMRMREVAAFLAQQVDALPPRLRILYQTGMAVFRFFVRLRYLRSFCALSLDRQRAAVDGWAFGRIGLLRQLFRPARSVVLLAYYEHEAARHAASAKPRSAVRVLEAHG